MNFKRAHALNRVRRPVGEFPLDMIRSSPAIRSNVRLIAKGRAPTPQTVQPAGLERSFTKTTFPAVSANTR